MDDSHKAAPFQTAHEQGWGIGGEDGQPVALLINPKADVGSLVAAAISRVTRLRKSLDCWQCSGSGQNISVELFASFHEPLAEEIELLLEAAIDLMMSGRKEASNG